MRRNHLAGIGLLVAGLTASGAGAAAIDGPTAEPGTWAKLVTELKESEGATMDEERSTMIAQAVVNRESSPMTAPGETAGAVVQPHHSAGMIDGKFLVNRDQNGLALQGYDPVSYFTLNRPVKGTEDNVVQYNGAKYRFVSEENRRTFEADPAAYEPEYGGYSGYGASLGRIVMSDPKVFQIVEGRLVLHRSREALEMFSKDPAGNFAKADEQWRDLVRENGSGEMLLLNVDKKGVAVEGYDVVSYFTENKPMKGRADHAAVYNGAIYHFASEAHREEFEKHPARYAPEYGGYCGYAASIDKLAPVDPEVWQVQDGRLILQYSSKTHRKFNVDLRMSIEQADRNWPGLVEENSKKKTGLFSGLF